MVNQSLGSHPLEEPLHDEILAPMLAHGVVHQFVVEQVMQPGQVQLAFIGRDVGSVPDPDLIGPTHCKLPARISPSLTI